MSKKAMAGTGSKGESSQSSQRENMIRQCSNMDGRPCAIPERAGWSVQRKSKKGLAGAAHPKVTRALVCSRYRKGSLKGAERKLER
jgi:hypothetical protein